MTTLQKALLGLSFSFTVFALILISNYPPQSTFASVPYANEYHSTTTRSAVLGAALTTPQLLTALNAGAGTVGTLGSVVITGKNTGITYIYDATSTNPHSDYATSTLAIFPANTPEGTYTFDVIYTRGLIVETPSGLVATSTITFR